MGFQWRVDWLNLSLAVFKAPLADSDLNSRGQSSLMALLDSLRSDVPIYMPHSDIFLFPFSLRVSRVLIARWHINQLAVPTLLLIRLI